MARRWGRGRLVPAMALVAWGLGIALPDPAAFALLTRPGGHSVLRSELTLESLRAHGPTTATFTGPTIQDFPAEAPCLYFETAYGIKNDEGWVVSGSALAGGDAVTMRTPFGDIDVGSHAFRLYLPPAYTRGYAKAQKAAAPEFLHHLMDDEAGPFTVETVRLVKGPSYHVLVDVEAYYLPPLRPDGPPEERHNHVLAISDLPFVDGRAQRQLTLRGRQHRY